MSKIKDLYKDDRPREKLIKKGVNSLKKEELLAILLRTGIKGRNALRVSEDVLKKYNKKNLVDASYQELKNIHGVGSSKAVHILAAIELGKRLHKNKEKTETYINGPEDVFNEVKEIGSYKKEY